VAEVVKPKRRQPSCVTRALEPPPERGRVKSATEPVGEHILVGTTVTPEVAGSNPVAPVS
jgi:hypothetical protein